MARIPSLDGLRALSIFLVMALHSLQRLGDTHSVPTVWFGIFNGGTGVSIFFVISGYLITRLLLNEHQKRGSISLRGFYLRRAMRILPPLYAYVAFLLLLGWVGRLVIAMQYHQRPLLLSQLCICLHVDARILRTPKPHTS